MVPKVVVQPSLLLHQPAGVMALRAILEMVVLVVLVAVQLVDSLELAAVV
jgi:hypothetical protein